VGREPSAARTRPVASRSESAGAARRAQTCCPGAPG
jgi:hypothetical protein